MRLNTEAFRAQGMARAVIELPTASEDVTVGFAFVDVTISEIRAVLRGTSTPSVTWTLRYDSDRSAAGTEVITGGTVTTSTSGQTITTFTNDTIPAGSYFWLETTAQSGTVQELAVSIFSAGLR